MALEIRFEGACELSHYTQCKVGRFGRSAVSLFSILTSGEERDVLHHILRSYTERTDALETESERLESSVRDNAAMKSDATNVRASTHNCHE